MRFDCPVHGFEDNFVEITERWSRKDVRNFYELKGEEYLSHLRTKIVSINLGSSVQSPEDFTSEKIEDVDMQVWKWFSTAVNLALDTLYSMGEEIASRWLREQGLMTTRDGNPKQK